MLCHVVLYYVYCAVLCSANLHHTTQRYTTMLIAIKLNLGASLFPCYVFGGTSFFNNLATGDGLLSKFSRKMQMGLTIFYGHFGE